MTQTLNEPRKRRKNRRNVKSWKIRMQKQISSWRKELSIIAEAGTALIMNVHPYCEPHACTTG